MKENIISNEQPKAKLSKKTKQIIAIVLVLVIVVGLFAGYKINETAINNEFLYKFMPESQVSELSDGSKLTVYVEKDPDYKAEDNNDSPFAALVFYYLDDNNEKVIIDENSDLEYTRAEYQMAFAMAAGEKVQNIKKVITPVFAVIIAVLVIIGIALWFKSFCRREDEAKQKKYSNKNNKKKNK